jgi:hypothetical protein
LRGRVPSGAWIQCGPGVGDPGGAWIWCGGGEPSGAEQQFCEPIGRGLGRPAVLLLDCGVEKSSKI